MLDTIIFARDKWLKKGGLLFPDKATLFICAAEDRQVQAEKINFWDDVYGFNMSSMRNLVISEPMVDYVYPDQVVTNSCLIREVDLYTVQKEDLEFSVHFQLQVRRNDNIQVLVTFFNVDFTKCHKPLGFSTSPGGRHTHWKQTIFYLDHFVPVKKGEEINGIFSMKHNLRNFRDLDYTIRIDFDGVDGSIHGSNTYRMR